MIKSFLTKSNKKKSAWEIQTGANYARSFAVFLFKMSLIVFSFGK